ncbi:radical SAM protein [candidate division KSB1 bacterium]|nr:radical SAM protein [candidate division KSB1 bacterium]
MDVVLIIPSAPEWIGAESTRAGEHLGTAYLGAMLLKHGIECKIVDTRLPDFNLSRLISEINENDVQIVGITDVEVTHSTTSVLTKHIRRYCPDVRIVLGGYYPTFCYQEILRENDSIDFIVRGEGEFTFLELCQRLLNNQEVENVRGISFYDHNQEKVIEAPSRELVDELDQLPFPRRDHLSEYLRLRCQNAPSILSSRGCFGNCSFCSSNAFYKLFSGKKWRGRSAGNFVDELCKVSKDFDISYFRFWDDNFIGGIPRCRQRAYEIADEIQKRCPDIQFTIMCRANDIDRELFAQLKKAGLKIVFLGIEAMNESSLKVFNKGLTREQNWQAMKTLMDLEIRCEPGFIMFEIASTLDGIRQNLEFFKEYLKETKSKGIHFSHNLLYGILEVYRGTSLEKKLHARSLLQRNPSGIYQSYRFLNPKVAFLAELVTSKLAPKTKMIDEEIRTVSAKLNGHVARVKELQVMKYDLNQFAIQSFGELIDMVEQGNISNEQMSEFDEKLHQKICEHRSYLKNIKIDL